MAKNTERAKEKRAAAGVAAQAEYARHRGGSEAYVSKLKDRGILIMRGTFVDIAASDAVLDDNIQTELPPPTTTTAQPDAIPTTARASGGDYARARTLEKVLRSRLLKIELDWAEGRVLDAESVRNMVANAGRTLRDGLLSIPDRLAPVLAAEVDHAKVHALLRAEIVRELNALADAIDGI
jgi:hypothetical protein